MQVVDVIFYAFATITALAAAGVIRSRSPVHSVLFLILTFFSTAAVFVLLEAEFLAALLVMVYMGAVAVLFLFVIMMLDVDFATLKEQALSHLPVGLAVGLVILAEFVVIATQSQAIPSTAAATAAPVANTLAIGRVMYTQYLYPFEVASLVLLVALIGAIVLTLRKRERGAKRQNISQQIARTRAEAVELVKRQPGEGA
ncbi:MAG: NADH-quinone oxidoreductase subunit J [Magnetococcales bacterium]|nr:NADH-quinone oxidoreductase subunit J [Magnetococcales bacterium]